MEGGFTGRLPSFGLAWQFYGLATLRFAVLGYTIWLLNHMRRVRSFRAYDKSEFAWGIVFVAVMLSIDASHPKDFAVHVIVAVLSVFITLLVIPNRFSNQIVLALAIIAGETFIMSRHPQAPAFHTLLSICVSLFLATTIGGSASWQLHAYRRRQFLAREKERTAREELERLAENIPDAVVRFDTRLRYLYVNPAARSAGALPPGAQLGRTVEELGLSRETAALWNRKMTEAKETGQLTTLEYSTPGPQGMKFYQALIAPEFAEDGSVESLLAITRDLTARKRAEIELEASRGVLEIVNRCTELDPLLQESIRELRDLTHCEAVGIRLLDESGNIPYAAYLGFSREFYEIESPLAIHTDECMCINVIKGATDPKLSFYTEGGSFYMNGSTRFLAKVSEEEKGRTRNVCNRMGYESVALVPIRVGTRIRGLIHVADPREDMVRLNVVGLLEQIASALGVGIQRALIEREVRGAHDRAAWLARLPEENPNSVLRVSADGKILYRNPAAAGLPGWDCEVGQAAPAELLPLLERAMERGENTQGDVELGGRDYSVRLAPFRSERYANVYGQDVTERRRADEALRQRTLELQELTETLERRVEERTAELERSSEKLQAEMVERLRLVAAVEQAAEGIVITDSRGLIDFVNPAFERTSGKGNKEVLGKSYCEVAAGDDLRKNFPHLLERGETWSGQVNRKGKDGQALDLDVTFSSIRAPSGEVINYVAVERDVTREARLEQHLRQMQKMEALGTLAGGIAHDFNNLLNPVLINTELILLDAPLDPAVRLRLQSVLKAAERGRDLIKQIVTFSRMKEKARKPTEAQPLVKEVLKFLRSSLPTTIEIRENTAEGAGFILADSTQIHQVVMNLCTNAAYAMREQGGVLDVGLKDVEVDSRMAELHPELRPGPYLRLTVADTGAGMTREVMERAFDPFFTTKKPGEGTGMGLAVVHGIVRDHGGAVTVYSEPGEGSTFHIYLPRLSGIGGSPETVSAKAIATGNERILLLDDEETQAESVRALLERLGYRVVARTDSREALALFRHDPRAFDLVITDQTMPHMTGVRLAEELLQIRPDVRIILCTGFSESLDAEKAGASGIGEFVMKLFSVQEIAETIRRALAKR